MEIALQNLRKNFNFSRPKFNIDLDNTSIRMVTDTRIIHALLVHEYGYAAALIHDYGYTFLAGNFNPFASILWDAYLEDAYLEEYMFKRFYFSSKLKPKLKSGLYLVELNKYLKEGK